MRFFKWNILFLIILLCNCSQKNNDMDIFENTKRNDDKFAWTFDWTTGWNFEEKKEDDVKLDNIKQLESRLEARYRELILNSLKSILKEDRISEIELKIIVDDNKLTDKIIVFMNIDGVWKRKFDEKKQPVILWDGTIEREYIPVPPEELLNVTNTIKDVVGYSLARGDSVTVTNIAFDRTAEFAEEDAAYFRKQKIKTMSLYFINFIIVGLVIMCFIFCLINKPTIKYYKRTRLNTYQYFFVVSSRNWRPHI